MLNWIFVDKDMYVLWYGGCKDIIGYVIGFWGWSDDEDGCFFMLQGNYVLFVVRRVEIGGGCVFWGVYWDFEQEMLGVLEFD